MRVELAMVGRKQENARPAVSASARVSDSSRLARRRVLRSVAVFVVVMGGFYAVVHNPARPLRVFEGYHHAIAVVSGGVLAAVVRELRCAACDTLVKQRRLLAASTRQERDPRWKF